MTVLVADDDQNDRSLLRYAAAMVNPGFTLQFVHDGAELLEYLKAEGQFKDRDAYPLPGLLVLDVGMPKISGLEILLWLAASEKFRDLKVVMLTGSDDPEAVALARNANASYFRKIGGLDFWVELVRGLEGRLKEVASPET
jgi:CheY-like chemotaxis protein